MAGTGSGSFFQNYYPFGTGTEPIFLLIKIRPDPDPDLFFKLISGKNRIQIFFLIEVRQEPDPHPKNIKFCVV